ncbi:MAG: urocanate hydratase, partial [Fusobacteriaceae bacterium]
MINNREIAEAMTIKLTEMDIPRAVPKFDPKLRRAPMRTLTLTKDEIKLALKNALRYVPGEYHEEIAPEFLNELLEHGRI